jgi:excisionase family DNA binding protein
MSDKLLNTAEAARFLRVSQASVRRWSDSGILVSRRVGRRRERRFRPEDLEHFLKPARTAPPREGLPNVVNVGGTMVPLYSHLATFYNSDAGRLRLTVPFLSEGLSAGQPCFLVAAGHVLDAYLAALQKQGVDVEAALSEGRMSTAPAPGATVESALSFWEVALTRALASGPNLLRAVGEMSSARQGFDSDRQMIDFEVALNTIFKRLPIVVLCQYDVRDFDGETIFQAIRAHPDLYEIQLGTFLI